MQACTHGSLPIPPALLDVSSIQTCGDGGHLAPVHLYLATSYSACILLACILADGIATASTCMKSRMRIVFVYGRAVSPMQATWSRGIAGSAANANWQRYRPKPVLTSSVSKTAHPAGSWMQHLLCQRWRRSCATMIPKMTVYLSAWRLAKQGCWSKSMARQI